MVEEMVKKIDTPTKKNTSELVLRSPHFHEIHNEPSANEIIAASSLKHSHYSGSSGVNHKKDYLKNLPLQQKLTLEQLKHFNRLPKRTKQVYNGTMLLPTKKGSQSRTHDRKNVKSVPKDIVRGLNPSDVFGTTVRKIRTKRGTRNSSSKGTLSSGRSRSSTRSKGAYEEFNKEFEFDTKKYVKNVLPLVDQKKKKNVVRLFSPSTRQKIYQGRFFEQNP